MGKASTEGAIAMNKARTKALTPEKRSAIASNAATVKWARMTPARRSGLARIAAVARWAEHRAKKESEE